MKADFTRFTFRPAKHYRTVRMQQGRVQTDADWNEQQDILNHRIETETVDSLGPSAGPIGDAGFELTTSGKDVHIGAGHYYVDGLLCENPTQAEAIAQPDLPHAASPVMPAKATVLPLPPAKAKPLKDLQAYNKSGKLTDPPDGFYIGYLEAWERHITALEDGLIREVALGGPDTATREQTVWQVKFLHAGKSDDKLNCLSELKAWTDLVTPPDGTLAARSQPSTPPKNPCLLSPEAGYRRLENLLYRVEIHDDGSLSDKVRYKWSHDNGSIATKVTRWLGDPVADEFEVASIGRDAYLAIVPGCWVEFYDDTHELLGQPGTLVQVLKTAGNVVTVDVTTATGSLDADMFPANPRVRRWDGWDEMTPATPASNSGWVGLEDGVEIKFTPGSYRIGDYWMIPARTATADVEWPEDDSGKPVFQSPLGILRAFARLAVLSCKNGKWKVVSDCRHEFPALSELTNLYYVGGDGQAAMPDVHHLGPASLPDPHHPGPAAVALPQPLEVAVYNGQFPVEGAEVRFTAKSGEFGNGKPSQTVTTDADGIASVTWKVGLGHERRTAIAELLEEGQPATGKYNEIHFSAQLSVATQVAYNPANCPPLAEQGVSTVQDAIDALCQKEHGSGGCCTTVGEGGEFATLDQAMRTLIEQGNQEICLCLLPGLHQFADDLRLTSPKPAAVTIHGAGRATQVQLRNQAFSLTNFASVDMRDFDMHGLSGNLSLVLKSCADVRLSGLNIYGATPPGASLVSISDALRIEVSDNRLSSYLGAALDKAVAVLAKANALKTLRPSLNMANAELYRPVDSNVVATLAKLNAAQRKKAATEIDALLRSSNDPTVADAGVKRALMKVRDHLAKPSDGAKLSLALEGLRGSLAMVAAGFALALDAPAAITTVTNNTIQGRLSLYGESTSGKLIPQTVLKPLATAMKRDAITLAADPGYLRLLNNRLSDVRLGNAFVAALGKIVKANKGAIVGCYHSLVANDNEWLGANNEMLAINLGLSMNVLQPSGDFGTCIATQSKYLSNFAYNECRLINLGNGSEAFGNGSLNLINM